MGIYRAMVANGFIKPAKAEPKTADAVFQHIRGEIMAGNVLGKGYLAGIGMTIGAVVGWWLGRRAGARALDALDDAVDTLATKIATASRSVVALGKRAFYAQIDASEADAYRSAVPVMSRNRMLSRWRLNVSPT